MSASCPTYGSASDRNLAHGWDGGFFITTNRQPEILDSRSTVICAIEDYWRGGPAAAHHTGAPADRRVSSPRND